MKTQKKLRITSNQRRVGGEAKCGHFWKELKSLGNWVEMMWKAACNQNYKAPENYGQRLDIIHSLLRTLNVADQASDWDWGKARQGKKQILNSSEWTKFNDSKRKNFLRHHIWSPRLPHVVSWSALISPRRFPSLSSCQTTEKFSINLKCLRFPSTAFKWKNLYFCQQICCLLCCEYWIMVTQTTNSSSRSLAKSGNFRFAYFLI